MRIILLGYGVVGQSLGYILEQRQTELTRDFGLKPKVVAVVDRGGAAINPQGLELNKILTRKKENGSVSMDPKEGVPGMPATEAIETVEAEVVVEVTPTNIRDGEPALSHMKTAFKHGKHVVTTNKGPLALALPVLTELADYNEVYLRFSGTVGAGTPVLDLAKKCLLGDKIKSIRGILNGTTNYILTKMAEEHITFQQALQNAQNLGYAEADPTMDIDGIDAATKLVIMANWIMKQKVTLKDVKIQGIQEITPDLLESAAHMNNTIKLLGSIDQDLKVEPTEISRNDPLCVKGVLNAVTFVSEFAGEETIIGRGAGGRETASAVLRDLLDIKQSLAAGMAWR